MRRESLLAHPPDLLEILCGHFRRRALSLRLQPLRLLLWERLILGVEGAVREFEQPLIRIQTTNRRSEA